MVSLRCLTLSLLTGLAWTAMLPSRVTGQELPLLLREDFARGTDRWEALDPEGWKTAEEKGARFFRQFDKQSKYKPPHRSPLHIALLRDLVVGDFQLTVRARSTCEDYGHRDLCLFFGYQDAAHFHYVHFGKKTDDHANQIFIVNGKDRVKVSTRTTPGTNWDDEWHTLRIERAVKTGAIDVFFDNMKEPVMVAQDKTLTWGRVGIGSFDDTGDWDDFELRGERVKR